MLTAHVNPKSAKYENLNEITTSRILTTVPVFGLQSQCRCKYESSKRNQLGRRDTQRK